MPLAGLTPSGGFLLGSRGEKNSPQIWGFSAKPPRLRAPSGSPGARASARPAVSARPSSKPDPQSLFLLPHGDVPPSICLVSGSPSPGPPLPFKARGLS